MISQAVQDALNKQINIELISSYTYLAMSAYCEKQNFIGSAQWLRTQSNEEQTHALKLLDFLLARDCQVVLQEIPKPRAEFESIAHVFRQALENEISVSKSIDALYELAHHEKAFAALVELQWFITEQVQEEKTAREIVTKFSMVENDPSALLDLDRELGQRKTNEE
jgi:ferritin